MTHRLPPPIELEREDHHTMKVPGIIILATTITVLATLAIAIIWNATSTPQDPNCPDGMTTAYIDTEHHYVDHNGEKRTHPAVIHTCVQKEANDQ